MTHDELVRRILEKKKLGYADDQVTRSIYGEQQKAKKGSFWSNIIPTGAGIVGTIGGGIVGGPVGAAAGGAAGSALGERLRQKITGEDYSPEKMLSEAAWGSLGGIGGKAIKAASVAGKTATKEGAKQLAKKSLASQAGGFAKEKAAASFGKLSPTVIRKASEAGHDLNKLLIKYKNLGNNYDEILGPISAKGKGGNLGRVLGEAEDVIQSISKTAGSNIRISGDNIISALKSEAESMASVLGGEAKAKALNEIIEQAEKKYAKGITVKQALNIVRKANSKFGKSILETSGDAVATSAQKLEANDLRNSLKSMFPEMGDALDMQSELLTLRPVLNNARAATKAGKVALGRLDVTRPGTVVDSALNNPRLANIVMGAGGKQATAPTMGRAVAKAGAWSTIPGYLGGRYSERPQSVEGEDVTYLDDPPTELLGQVQDPEAERRSKIKNVFDKMMLQDLQNTGGENMKALQMMQEQLIPAEAEMKIDASGQKRLRALDQAESTYNLVKQLALEAPAGVAGVLKAGLGRIPGVEGGSAEDLQRITDGLAKSIAGAMANEVGMATDRDIERWKGLMPKVGDTLEERKRALARLKQAIDEGRQMVYSPVGDTSSNQVTEADLMQMLGLY